MIRMMLAAGLFVGLVSAPAPGQLPRHHPPLRPSPPSSAPASAPSSAPTTEPAGQQQGGDAAKGDQGTKVTEHRITLAGRTLRYRATAGTLALKNDEGKPRASMFFVAYGKLGDDVDPATRPITYVFNGGPGAASVWLHLGALGPRRIALEPDGRVPAPPHRLVDNESTWLDATDLVFIDPVGTGFSRAAPGEKPEQFYGVEQDIAAVAEFIRLYTTKYQRWSSPKFLAGESYGTTRAAGLSEHLIDRQGIALNGILFISTVLDFATIRIDDNNPLGYPLFLPTYAATAFHHKKLAQPPADLRAFLREVNQWALTEYTAALAQGDALPPDQRTAVTERLARYTGLPVDMVAKTNLRIGPAFFQKNLLADRRTTLGRFDSRITGYSLDPETNWPEYDPALSQYYPVYSSTFNDYVRRELGYESDLTYEVLSGAVRPWSFGQENGGYLNVATRLRSALAKNPHMRLFFASGYFDLATPFAATDYTVGHLDLSPDLRRNITETYYMGGHMMYHSLDALVQLKQDIARFYSAATPSRPSTTQPTP